MIKNTQDFAQMIREQPPREENEEYVESLLRTFPFMTP